MLAGVLIGLTSRGDAQVVTRIVKREARRRDDSRDFAARKAAELEAVVRTCPDPQREVMHRAPRQNFAKSSTRSKTHRVESVSRGDKLTAVSGRRCQAMSAGIITRS
jgi:hypothetical protein